MAMELVQGFRLPYGEPPDAPEPERPLGLREAGTRALAAANDAPTAHPRPWRLYLLGAEAALQGAWHLAQTLGAEHGPEAGRAAYEQWRAVPGWVVVTRRVAEDAEAAERLREDTLTAVQRFTLQLWSDNAPSRWLSEADGLPRASGEALFRLVGADPVAEVLVGLIHFGHPEG